MHQLKSRAIIWLFFILVLLLGIAATVETHGQSLPNAEENGSPLISQQPESQSIARGGTLRLQVQAVGASPLRYQWQLNGNNLRGATQPTLTIRRISPAREGTYRVLVASADGVTLSDPASVEVVVPPRIALNPRSQRVGLHHDVSFEVLALGDEPLTYRWWHRDHAIPIEEGPSVTNRVLTIVDVLNNYDYNGRYWAVVGNTVAATQSRAAKLTVLDPPVLLAEPSNQRVKAGNTAVFSVQVAPDKAGRKSYQWAFNNEPLPRATSPRLVLRNVQFSQAGFYNVRVSSRGGMTESFTAELHVTL